jgi:hypothetical protein
LEKYKTVILVAKWISIAGILSYVRHMTYRRVSKDKNHEAYWIMDDNSQQDWLAGWMADLQSKDSEKVSIIYLTKIDLTLPKATSLFR